MSLVFSVVIAFVLSSGSWRPASVDEPCQPLSPPKRMPTIGQLVDTLGLLRRLRALDSTASGEVIVSVTPSEPPAGYPVDLPTTSPRQDSIVEFVVAAVRPSAKGTPVRFRVRVQYGATATATVEPSILCRPVTDGGSMRQAPVVGQVMVRTTGGTAPPVSTPPRQVTARLHIDAAGRVVDVDLGSGSGYDQVDRSIRETMISQRFLPATLDGRPAEVWLSGNKAELVR